MQKKSKLIIGMLALAPIITTGCSKDRIPELEVVDEVILTEDEVEAVQKTEETSKEDEKSQIEESSEGASRKEELSEGASKKEDKNKNPNSETSSGTSSKPVKEEQIDNIVLESNPVFTKSEITEDIKSRMLGNSMPSDSTIGFEELSYLKISHVGYDGKTKQGEMIVHKKLADEVLEIFKEIYYAKFPIEKMNLIDNYGASDHASMVDNNSSAFCYRVIAGTNKLSKHGQGVAIDINPFYNPHVLRSSGTVNPPEASKYADRSLNSKGMIKKNDVVYKAFTSRGWTWGGSWNNPDYQHFQKSI